MGYFKRTGYFCLVLVETGFGFKTTHCNKKKQFLKILNVINNRLLYM